MIRKKWFWVSLLGIILILSGLFTMLWNNQHKKNSRIQSQAVPTILIPGSSAGPNRFDSLVADLNRRDDKQHSLLRLTVNTNNRIDSSGTLDHKDRKPFIVIAFQNNHDGYSNIKKQAQWVRAAIRYLQNNYHLTKYNLVGHSNGGLVFTYYMEHYLTTAQPNVKKFMFIGSPFNFSTPVGQHRTPMLQDFITYRTKLPKNILVFGILGSQTYTSDGRVPVQSVDASRLIFQGQVQLFNELLVTGKNSEHSDLVTKVEVETLIHNMVMHSAS